MIHFLSLPPPLRFVFRYMKAMYREYTDGSFTVLRNRSASDLYLGSLGPVLRAQVGDTLRIVFKNQLSK